MQRAAEATKHFENIRPDGNATNTAQRNGYIEHLENLGLSSSNTSLYDFIVNSWAGSEERGIIAAHNGHWAQGGGHYFVLIHPKRTAFGFAKVRTQGGSFEYGYSTAAAYQTTTIDTTPSETVTEWIYRAPTRGEKPTGVKEGAPSFDSFGDFGSSSGGGIMGILAGLVSLISLLGFIAQFAVKFLPRLPGWFYTVSIASDWPCPMPMHIVAKPRVP